MSWQLEKTGGPFWRRKRQSACGAWLDGQDIVLAALSWQKTGGIRVMGYEHLHRQQGLTQALRSLGAQLPTTGRTLVLALAEGLSRRGLFDWAGARDMRRLQAEVQLEAAAAWGVGPHEVCFDFRLEPVPAGEGPSTQQVRWAACLREELQTWQLQVRTAGWRLPGVETEDQALQRAFLHLRGDAPQHRADSARDWQFASTPQRQSDAPDGAPLPSAAMCRPLAACGAALVALL